MTSHSVSQIVRDGGGPSRVPVNVGRGLFTVAVPPNPSEPSRQPGSRDGSDAPDPFVTLVMEALQ